MASLIDPQQNCPLNKIPLETLVRITFFISTGDLGNVRLTCRALERSLFNFFSHEFFRKKQFMVSTFSLQALLDISKHPALSQRLKHVVISTDRYTSHNIPHSVRTDLQVRRAFNETCADHDSLWATGQLNNFLTEAFKNLTNLEIIDLRDFNSPTRKRDGRSLGTKYWNSYGAPTLTAQFSMRPIQDSRGPDEPTYRARLFQAVVASLAMAEAHPKSMEVITRTTGLVDSAFFIPARIEQSIAQVLSGLTKLHLVIHPNFHEDWDMSMKKKFLLLTPEVTNLRLNYSGAGIDTSYGYHPSDQTPASLLSWICGLNDDGTPLANPSEFPSFELETLELGNLFIRPPHLSRLATRFASTLRVLGLRRVALTSRSEDPGDQNNLWHKVLTEQLPKVPGLDLRKIQLAFLQQDGENVMLIDPLTKAQNEERTYTGDSMTKIIQKVGAEITAVWPDRSGDALKDGEESESDGEDGSEDEEMED